MHLCFFPPNVMYFLINTSPKSHAIELSLFRWPDDATESVATTINHLHAPVTCFMLAALVPKFMTLKSGMKAWDSLETMIMDSNPCITGASHSLRKT